MIPLGAAKTPARLPGMWLHGRLDLAIRSFLTEPGLTLSNQSDWSRSSVSNQKLRDCFCQALGISHHTVTENLAYNTIPEWDSVGHMALVAELESAFDVMFETDDIVSMNSVVKAVEILKRLGVSLDDA